MNASAVSERLSWATEALQAAAAVSAADRLGVLAVLESGPVPMETLARTCRTDVRSTGVLLDALLAMGLVSISDGRFHAAVPHLSALGAISASGDLLTQAIRSGRAPMQCDMPSGASRSYPDAVSYLAALLAHAADTAADQLGEAHRVLDVGAGAAPWSLAVARRNPGCRITALDLAAVITVTQRAVSAAGCADRFDYISGDVFGVALAPATYDLVLLGNLCHLFDEPTNRKLLRRLRPAILDGGRIAVIDALPSQDEAAQRAIRLYGVGLLTRSTAGGVHDLSSYLAWFGDAGFRTTSVRQVSRTPPVSIVMGST